MTEYNNLKKIKNNFIVANSEQLLFFFQFCLFSFVCLVFFIIGMRPLSVGTDTLNYFFYYQHYIQEPLLEPENQFELFFRQLIQLSAYFSFSFSNFLSVIALLVYGLILMLFKNLNELSENKLGDYRLLFLLLTFLFISPYFFSMTTNVIRQGIAILALSNLYVAFFMRKSLLTLVFFAVVALGFHKTSMIGIGLIFLLRLPYSTIFKLSVFMFITYVTSLTIKIIQWLSIGTGIDFYSHLLDYGLNQGYQGGVRYDFALFTVGWGVIFDLLNRYVLPLENRDLFQSLLKIYWIFSFPFFLLGFSAYSDRFLLASWFFLSILGCFFLGFLMKKYQCSIRRDFCIFMLSSLFYLGRGLEFL